ncbi:hypothetical protein [Sphingomonas sp. Leaf4]|uniref:hypothetical protein n=1 Tax=Sphingomonas sp. Leaf4 TaxID=2876553 RepID=UPI001E5D727E|nr:hypothetical protein [Sphingomonas sp. Leaf4]
MTMAETPVTVEPCDREAARRLREEIQRQIGPSSGLIAIEDDDFDVQLFARHRAASAPVVAAGPVDRLTIGTILARNFSRFIPNVSDRIRVGNAACNELFAALARAQIRDTGV